MIFTKFSHAFLGTAKILAILNRRLKALSTCIYIFHRNHSPLQHFTVLLLLFYSPGSHFPHETRPISLHKPPRTVNKPPDDFNQASIKNLKSPLLGCCKICLWMFSIPVFTPSPVLNSIMSRILSNLIDYYLPSQLGSAHNEISVKICIHDQQP
jgi:hypothetical protein